MRSKKSIFIGDVYVSVVLRGLIGISWRFLGHNQKDFRINREPTVGEDV
jgi:hypothetical protein